MNVRIEVAFPDDARVAEGPFWDALTGRLSWVDILSGAINELDPATSERTRHVLPTLVGAAIPKDGGGYVAATTEGFATVDADGAWSNRVTALPDGQRMNDAKCDPFGRLWSGSTEMSFAPGQGALHVLDLDWRSETVLDGLTLPNGLGWSPDGRTFYLIDSMASEILAFDVEGDSTVLSRRRRLASFGEGEGLPDGMTVDAAGCLWVAMWGGAAVRRLTPDGDVIEVINLPVEQPSSCAFGGADLDVLYVTTAREGLDLAQDAPDGSVFAVHDVGVGGLPSMRFGG